MFCLYQSSMFLLFSDVPKMATRPDGIISRVGSISAMNALTITTEGLFLCVCGFHGGAVEWTTAHEFCLFQPFLGCV